MKFNEIFKYLSISTIIDLIGSYFRSWFKEYDWIVHEDWKDDLIWCPSQCYKKIEINNKQYVIYLRWRWNDPWTADLVECPLDGNFDMLSKDSVWTTLNVDHFRDDQLDKLKKDAEKKAYQWIALNFRS
jgi:hypothetical protein